MASRGSRTCHAAIIARELGIPAVLGCENATETIADAELITVCCAEGDTGSVYRGRLDFEQQTVEIGAMPTPPVKIMMNVGNPDRAFDFGAIPNTVSDWHAWSSSSIE
jgi:pyruvate,water dikinase